MRYVYDCRVDQDRLPALLFLLLFTRIERRRSLEVSSYSPNFSPALEVNEYDMHLLIGCTYAKWMEWDVFFCHGALPRMHVGDDQPAGRIYFRDWRSTVGHLGHPGNSGNEPEECMELHGIVLRRGVKHGMRGAGRC